MATTRCSRCRRAMTVSDSTRSPVCADCRRSPASATGPPRGSVLAILLGIIGGVALAGVLIVAIVAFFANRYFASPPAGPIVAKEEHKQPLVKSDEGAPKQVPPSDAGKPSDKGEAPAPKKTPIEKPPENKPSEKKPPEPKPAADPKGAQELADTLLRQLNTYRKTAGLRLVQTDAEMSAGCAAHANYLALNPPGGPGDAARLLDEDPSKPGFSEDGKRAASFAMVSIGNAKTAVDHWMARLGGRLPLLQPDLRAIGVGLASLGNGQWAVVVDVLRGTAAPVVVFPAPRQADVPLSNSGGAELAEPSQSAGFPVSATFAPTQKVMQVKAVLQNDAGKAVDAWLFTPEKPARDKGQRNTIALITKAPLAGNTVYRVQMSATVDGAPWSKNWEFTTEDGADGKGLWAMQALDKVNGVRKLAGLPAVTLDANLSKACAAHAQYLVLNHGHPATLGLGAHDEDLSLPGASEDGRKAGKAADISIGDRTALTGIDSWMATLYHRVPILEPNLKEIGYGCARGRRQGWVTVLDVGTGRPRGVQRAGAVFYPVPDQTGVPLHFPIGGEEPNPIPEDTTGKAGFPVTAFFPENTPLKSAAAMLTDAAGKEVPVWFSSPEQPANPKYVKHQGNTVCLIPKQPLHANAVYRVMLRGKLAGLAWEKTWQFTTGDAGPTAAQAVQQVLGRLNAERAVAGLAAVAYDPELSKGCQAHAEYLVRNAAVIALKKLAANDEDPALPGYTAVGLASARQSAVFRQAPDPVAQIDDIMGSFMQRVYLLDPLLHRIGLGCAREIGRGWQCVLDLNGGRGATQVVRFPVPDQDGVPCAGTGRLPGKATVTGYPITVTFPPQVKLLGGKGVLTDADGKTIDSLLTTPERPFDPGVPQRNTVCLVPLAPLQPGRTYSVMISVVVNGQEWRQSWQFATE